MFSYKSIRAKYVMKLAVAGLVGMALAYWLNIDFTNTMMLIFFSMLMVQSTIGATLDLIRPLIGWSLLGVGVGMITVVLFEPLIDKYSWAMWPVIGVLVLYGAFTLPIHRLARLNFISALMVLMVGKTVGSPTQLALYRAIALILAVAVSVPVSYLIFPVRASRLMRDASSEIVEHSIDILRRIFGKLGGGWDYITEEIRGVRDQVQELAGLIDHARKEGMQMRHERVRRILMTLYRTLHYLFSLDRLAAGMKGNQLLEATHASFEEIGRRLEQAVALWEMQLYHPPESLQMPDFEAPFAEIEKVLQRRREEGIYVSIEETSAFFSLLHTLHSFADDLREGTEELHRLQVAR